MKNGGLLNQEALKCCCYPEFVQAHLKRFNTRILDKDISIEQTNSNFDAMCNRIMEPLKRIGLQIEKSMYTDEKYYVRLPKITRISKWSDRVETTEIGYKKVAESAIFVKFSGLIFSSDKEIEDFFSKILNRLNKTKWLTKDEKDKMEEISKSLSIQQQKEFTPYV